MVALSIVVPVYNTEKYLNKCLDSILAQSIDNYEVIVINDGSKDSSEQILKEYEARYPDIIKVIHQENHGIGYTRNVGIRNSKGKYITFIDSDDAILPNYCEALLKKAEESNLDMVVCDYYDVSEKTGHKTRVPISNFDDTNIEKSPNLLFDINSSPWNKIYRTELLRKYNIFVPENVKYEDVLFVLKVLSVARQVGKVEEALVDYLIRDGSETKVMNKRVFDIFIIFSELKQYFEDHGMFGVLKECFEWFCINRVTVYSIQQRYQKDWKDAKLFIERGYSYLEEFFPDWRKNKYYLQSNSILKRMLKNYKWVMYIFVKLTRKVSIG